MKTIFALSTVILMAFSDDIIDSVKSVKGFKNLNVPVAPFVWGSPDETAPESLKNIKAENANVPVAPFVWGNPEEAAPEI